MRRNCSLTGRLAGWSDSTRFLCQCRVCGEHREQWQLLAQVIDRQNKEFRHIGVDFTAYSYSL